MSTPSPPMLSSLYSTAGELTDISLGRQTTEHRTQQGQKLSIVDEALRQAGHDASRTHIEASRQICVGVERKHKAAQRQMVRSLLAAAAAEGSAQQIRDGLEAK